MKIAIVGAGLGGMSAAFDLKQAGHEVSIFESTDTVGGLASGVREPGWDWSVERYYHHWFQSDRHMLGLINELGLSERVLFPTPKTVVYYEGKFYRLDSPLAALTFPGFKFFDMVRFGLVTVYLRYFASWKPLENELAVDWMRKWYGERVYKNQFEQLMTSKFGAYAGQVNMAWMWARLKTRTTRLGTYQGGFQAFFDDFAAILKQKGVQIQLNTPIQQIRRVENGIQLDLPGGPQVFDRCLVTSSPGQMARLAPDLPEGYLKGLLGLKNMGAVVLVLALNHQLSEEGYYWFNLPKAEGYPFLALVEHTNFLKPEYFGGNHIVYCGDYLDPSHEYFQMDKEQILETYLQGVKKFNPNFRPDWVQGSWLFRTQYAQPVPFLGHSKNIPEIQTPIPGLYFASMSQVYPWDRGTNFAVEIGRRAAKLMVN